MKSVQIIFPNQLFQLRQERLITADLVLTEEHLFFRHFNFHKQKLAFHRASMKAFYGVILKKSIKVSYIESSDVLSDVRKLIPWLSANGYQRLIVYDPADDWLLRRIKIASETSGLILEILPSPAFLESSDSVCSWFSERKNYFQTDFYVRQRKRLNILIDTQGGPAFGKWTFDSENRLKYPKGRRPPNLPKIKRSTDQKSISDYLERNFASNPGLELGLITYPDTHQAAEKWLQDFLQNRFKEFGAFEDAIVSSENVLHHSLLTPLLNIGLLTPDQIIRQALDAAEEYEIPINSLEGFIRQIIGWREFIRGVYLMKGRQQRTSNFWGWSRQMPSAFYTGTTGIQPVDDAIQKVLSTGYNHHIERLMVLGNFMLLCEIHPDQVYQWFMEMYVDAYDWVMVPNVYGMSQFADGGLMCTKPYISGSNYILKMSDYPSGQPWAEIWDALFWRFMDRQRSFFLKNPRMGMLIRTFDKMESKRKKHLMATADRYLEKL